jgi:hypothetical protein
MKTLIKTFDNDIYIIPKSPEEVMEIIKDLDMVGMPNGSYIHKKSISAIQTYDDYNFQVNQKQRHKKGQYLYKGEWHDEIGSLGIDAHLEKITGEIKLLSSKSKS